MRQLALAALACLYTMDCPTGQLCAVNADGHGECRSAAYRAEDLVETGRCTFNYDCGAGETCLKTSLSDYGRCVKE